VVALALAVADRIGNIRIWDTETEQVFQHWQADDSTIWSLAWSRDGELLATAHADEFVRLWESATGAALCELTPHPGGATDLAFLFDGVTLATASRDGSIRLWDQELGVRLGESFVDVDAPLWRMVASDIGNWFATTSASGSVKIWNTLNKRTVCQQATWDRQAQKRYLGDAEHPRACR